MTILEALLSAARLPVLGVLFLLLTGWMAVLIAAFRHGRSRRFRGALLASFLPGTAVFWLCLSVISWENNYPLWSRQPPAWLAAFCACPVWVVCAFEAVFALLLSCAVWNTFRYCGGHVTPGSVKQAMDLLPVGVAFAGPDGAVCFRNLVMDHLSVALTGKLFTNWSAFQAAAGVGQVTVGDRVWQFCSCKTPGSGLTQITATDITEQACALEEMQAKNRKLRDLHLRLQIYNRQAERIVIAQELLTARMTVHDQLGSVLLESRHALTDPASIDETLLLQALKNANTYLLREYEGDDTAVDPLAEAVSVAQAIGVKVEPEGVPPEEEKPRAILGAAIRECAANAVKHAQGDCLQVNVRRTDEGYVFTLRGNGQPPAEPIRESGGLLSLRTLVERQGGTLHIACTPEVCVTVMVAAALQVNNE